MDRLPHPNWIALHGRLIHVPIGFGTNLLFPIRFGEWLLPKDELIVHNLPHSIRQQLHYWFESKQQHRPILLLNLVIVSKWKESILNNHNIQIIFIPLVVGHRTKPFVDRPYNTNRCKEWWKIFLVLWHHPLPIDPTERWQLVHILALPWYIET